MLNCKETTELCSQEIERPLRLGEQVALRTHLMMCSGCTRFRRQIRLLHDAATAYAEGRAVSSERDDDAR